MKDKLFIHKIAVILVLIAISIAFSYTGRNIGSDSSIAVWGVSTFLWIVVVIFCTSGSIKFNHPIKKVPSEYDFVVEKRYIVLSSVCFKNWKKRGTDYYLVVVKEDSDDDNFYTCWVDHPLPAEFIFAPTSQVKRYVAKES